MYNILSSQLPLNGWSNAFKKLGHNFYFWNPNFTPIFDMFDKYHPDVFILNLKDVSRGVVSVLKENPDVITILHVSGEDICKLEDIKQFNIDTNKPDYILSDQPINIDDISLLKLEPAIDDIDFFPCQPEKIWASDIAYIGQYNESVAPYLFPLCDQPYSFRIYGSGDWPIANYVGHVEKENIKKIYSSAKIIIDLGETPDTPYNVLACGGTCLTNQSHIFSANCQNFISPEDLKRRISVLLNDKTKLEKTNLIGLPTYTDKVKQLLKDIKLETN